MKIDDGFLNSRRFADDIYYYALEHHKNYNIYANELSEENRQMCLKMNIAKTK